MHLTQYETVVEGLKNKRKRLEFSQQEIADKANVSASHLSRIENGEVEATYKAVYRIWNALNEVDAEANTSTTAGDLYSEIDWVDTTDTVAEARSIMREKNYSQMPVRKPGRQKAIGSLTETGLMSVDDTTQSVKSVMEQPFVTVPPSTSRAAVAELLRSDEEAVLMTDGDPEHVQGIITKFDLI